MDQKTEMEIQLLQILDAMQLVCLTWIKTKQVGNFSRSWYILGTIYEIGILHHDTLGIIMREKLKGFLVIGTWGIQMKQICGVGINLRPQVCRKLSLLSQINLNVTLPAALA